MSLTSNYVIDIVGTPSQRSARPRSNIETATNERRGALTVHSASSVPRKTTHLEQKMTNLSSSCGREALRTYHFI